MKRLTCFAGLFVIIFLTGSAVPAQEPDRDNDGLSDFHETNKYLTDPDATDSDGDGIADGDWKERREYQYTIRSVVQVMKPVTPEYLNDDYQDVRILDETETYFELEVIHYPFNKVASTIHADENWRQTVVVMRNCRIGSSLARHPIGHRSWPSGFAPK